MWDTITEIISAGIEACSAWFMYILQAIGAIPSILAFFLAYCAFRFLLLPIFGYNAGSDRAFGKGNDDLPALPEGSKRKRRK